MRVLRPYQMHAIEHIEQQWREGHRAPLLVLPTGTGKTVVFVALAERVRPDGPVLILAHREELVEQACAQVKAWTDLTVGVEMAASRADGALVRPDVVVASVASLVRRLDRYEPEAFRLVIIDEAHHAPAASWRAILEHFPGALRLGVTATPDRLDGAALGGLFDSVAMVYELRDAIEDGYLVPIRQVSVSVKSVDLNGVRIVAGDLHEGELETKFMAPAALHGVAEPFVRQVGERRALLFGVSVAHAEALGRTIGGYLGERHVRWLSGRDRSEERRATVAAFRRGEFQVLVNCLLFTEGFDAPEISCVGVARPTCSRALYAQMIGRGTRPHPEDVVPLRAERLEKTDLLVLDFRGNAGRHRLVNTLDVLDGNRDRAVADRAQRLMNERAGMTVMVALRVAEGELAAEARQAAIRRARVDARYSRVDPFALLGVRPRAGRWGGEPITEALRERLERHRIPHAGLDHGQAEEVWRAVVERSRRGLSTLRQASVLARYGYDASEMSFAEASRLIDGLAKNRWRRGRPGVVGVSKVEGGEHGNYGGVSAVRR